MLQPKDASSLPSNRSGRSCRSYGESLLPTIKDQKNQPPLLVSMFTTGAAKETLDSMKTVPVQEGMSPNTPYDVSPIKHGRYK